MQSMAVALSAGSNANIGTNQSEKAENESIHNLRECESSEHKCGNFESCTFSLSRFPFILLSEDIVEGPWLQLCDVSQLASLAEVLFRVFAWN